MCVCVYTLTINRRPIITPPVQNRDGDGGPKKQLGRQACIFEGQHFFLKEEVGGCEHPHEDPPGVVEEGMGGGCAAGEGI